jgi:hypothetical protein
VHFLKRVPALHQRRIFIIMFRANATSEGSSWFCADRCSGEMSREVVVVVVVVLFMLVMSDVPGR